MITNAILGVFYGFVNWAAGLLPTGGPPAFLTQTSGALSSMLAGAQGLSAWVPWPFVLTVVGIVLALWLAVLVVKAVRWLLAWVPTWGGS